MNIRLGSVTEQRQDPTASVVLESVSKRHGAPKAQVVALDRLSLTVPRRQMVSVVGASGCGKSTLLNLIAGLDAPTAGTVDTGGMRTAFMFQEAALFPWLSVAANIELPLKLRGFGRADRRARAKELLQTVQLDGFADRQPHELSGGMRQRAALARSLAQDAELLLMDEPFGALDAMTRDVLHDELERVWQSNDLTVVFVTHNVREAVRLGDRVVVLTSRPGRIAADIAVEIDRPRRIESPDVSALAGEIAQRLRAEVARHAH